MPSDRNAFRLGLAILLFLALFIGVLVFLAPRGGGDFRVRVRFPHDRVTTTLKVGGEVICGGQPVGAIRSLELAEMKDPQTGQTNLFSVAQIKVDPALNLREDCRVVPEGPLLGGPGRLLILDRGVGRPIQPDAIIDGQASQDLPDLTRALAGQFDATDPASLIAMIRLQLDASQPDALMHKLHAAIEDIHAVTQRVRTELDPQQKEVLITKLHGILDGLGEVTRLIRTQADAQQEGAAMARIHATLDTLDRGLDTMVAMLNENRQPIKETITRIRSASEILEQQVAARLAAQLDPAQPASLLAKVHVAIDRLGEAVRDLNTVAGNTRDVVVTNKDSLNGMLANMKETSEHLKAASKEIRRNPWRLLYQPTLAEAEQANVHDAARAFAEAATRLDDAVIRLQAMSQDDIGPVEQQQIRDLADQLNRAFDGFNKAETALWERLDIK